MRGVHGDEFGGGVAVQPGVAGWYAAYTRPRHEQTVDQHWEAGGMETYLPTWSAVRRWSDRRKVLPQPLLPSYLFVRLLQEDHARAIMAPGFLMLVRDVKGPLQVDEAKLTAVRLLMAGSLEYDPIAGLQLGDEVEIVAGPLCGCRGRFLRKTNGAIALTISAINGSVRVVVSDATGLAARRLLARGVGASCARAEPGQAGADAGPSARPS